MSLELNIGVLNITLDVWQLVDLDYLRYGLDVIFNLLGYQSEKLTNNSKIYIFQLL